MSSRHDTKPNPLRAVGYVRVSTAHQAKEGLSLDEQVRRVNAYVAANDWKHADTFVERGVSGSVPFDERPEFSRLLGELPQVDRIVIPKLDRLGRSTQDLLRLFDTVEKEGVAIVSLSEAIDTSTSIGRLTRSVLAAIAEFERDRLSERVSEVTDAKAREGKWHGGDPPYGYEYGDGGGLIIVPAEAAIVLRIFAAYVAGKSQRQIQRDLNAEGIPAKRGKWSQGSISKMLSNPVHAGKTHLNGAVYEGVHEAIIDAGLWHKAQQMRTGAARSGPGRKPSANHLLAGGMLRCGRCGSTMGATTKDRNYSSYSCSGRATHGLDFCDQLPVKRELIDTAVWSFFTQVALDVDATRTAIAQAHQAKVGEITVLLTQADREATHTASRMTAIERDYVDGKMNAEQWARLDTNLTAELAAAEAQADRLRVRHDALQAQMASLDTESVLLDELAALRAFIAGEARDGSRAGADSLRAVLRRMFEPFVLVSVIKRDGKSEIVANPDPAPRPGFYGYTHPDLCLAPRWQEHDGSEVTYVLSPVVKTDAVAIRPTAADPFPALRKAALALQNKDSVSLPTTWVIARIAARAT